MHHTSNVVHFDTTLYLVSQVNKTKTLCIRKSYFIHSLVSRYSALSKEDIVEILNACDNIRLRTYLILLAATGMRAVEALSIRIKDIDFDSNPANLFVRGEYTKTKVDRIIFLTGEITQQLKSWLEYKHRTRRVPIREREKP